jgi:hypothetical protein
MTTRREVIVGGLATAACAVMSPVQAQSGTNGVDLSQVPGSVLLVPQSDNSFLQLLDQHFPKLSSNRHFLKIQKSAALVVNNDSRAVSGYQLRWRNAKAGEVPDSYKRRFLNRPSVELKARQMTGQVPLLTSGDVALVTPLFSWTKEAYQAKSSMRRFGKRRFLRYQARSPRGYGYAVRAQTADSGSVALAAVAFSDNVVGKKRRSFARVIRNMRNAEHDQALAVFNGVVSCQTGYPLALTQGAPLGTSSSTARRAGSVRRYEKASKRFAARLRYAYNSAPDHAQSVILFVKSASRSTIG